MNLPMWFSNVLSWAVQVGLLALAAALLLRLFRLGEPRSLLIFWRSLLVVSLALPLLQPWRPPASITPVAVISGADTVSFSAPPPAPTHWHFPDIQVISNAIGIAILAGILLRFALLALGLLKLRRFRETSTPIADAAESAAILKQMRANVGANADFRLSRDVESPVTSGLAKPVILLPERFLATDARFQSAIACHELLHVRRRDWAHHVAEEIVCASLWFHPAIAWFISRVRLAREQLVDLEVLTSRAPAKSISKLFSNSPEAALACLPFPHRHFLPSANLLNVLPSC